MHPEHGPGFDLWVGGGLSTNPMLAHKLGVWIPLDEVADAWEGVAGIFRDYGYRRLRSKARLKFLLADWGKEKFREVLENEYLHRALVDNPSPEAPAAQGDHIGIHEQKDGRFYVGAAPVVGRIDGTTLSALGDLVERYGASGARLTAYQKLVVIGVARRGHRGVRRRPREDRPHRAARATGAAPRWPAPASSSASWRSSTPRSARAALVTELEKRFPDLDTAITVNVNGCPNACARTQVADIGLKGQLVLDEAGNQVEGFQVHLGGALGLTPDAGPQAARPQGHQRRPRRLRHRRRVGVPRRPHRRRDLRRLGRPCRRGAAARGAGARMSERASQPFHCPYCGDENLFPHEGAVPGSAARACAPSPSR